MKISEEKSEKQIINKKKSSVKYISITRPYDMGRNFARKQLSTILHLNWLPVTGGLRSKRWTVSDGSIFQGIWIIFKFYFTNRCYCSSDTTILKCSFIQGESFLRKKNLVPNDLPEREKILLPITIIRFCFLLFSWHQRKSCFI